MSNTALSDRHDAYLRNRGFNGAMLTAVGALSVYSQTLEFRTEWVLWDLLREDVQGKHPSTDNLPIGELIKRLDKVSSEHGDAVVGELIALWCKTARLAFSCRNTIFHGLALSFGSDWATFHKAMPLHRELRKREPKEFHASAHTLGLLLDVFATLLDCVVALAAVARNEVTAASLRQSRRYTELKRALGIVGEIEDLAAAVNHEKY